MVRRRGNFEFQISTKLCNRRAWLGLRLLLLYAFFSIGSCTCNPSEKSTGADKANTGSATDEKSANDKLIARGKVVYNTSCIACHNSDPKKPGAIGPEIYGASLPLLEARVLKAGYPEGHKPKRTSAAMPALPYLKDDIPALHAFLNSP